MIDKATMQRILDGTDIVDVFKVFVTLCKAGVKNLYCCIRKFWVIRETAMLALLYIL